MNLLLRVLSLFLLSIVILFGGLMAAGILTQNADSLPNDYYISRDDEGACFLTNLDGNYIVLNRPLSHWRVKGDMVFGMSVDGVDFAFDTRLGKLISSGAAPGKPQLKQYSWR